MNERAPRPPLAGFVKAIVVRAGSVPREHVLWPDADLEVVFGLAPAGVPIAMPALQWAPRSIRLSEHMTLSVRLFPWAPLHLRNASAGRPDLLHVDVLDRLAARDCEGAVEAAEAWILARRESRSDDGLTAAIRRLYDAPEAAPLEALCDLAALSPRTLQRRMRAALGCTPKQLQRLARFQRASLALALDPAADLADLAYALGYADQPHFTREFSAFAGLSPTRFRRLLRR